MNNYPTTLSLVSSVIDSCVPYADKFLGGKGEDPRSAKKKLAVAEQMLRDKKAGKGPKLDKEKIKKFKEKAKKEVSEKAFSNDSYALDQVSKLSAPLDLVLPGAGSTLDTLYYAGTACNVAKYAGGSSYTDVSKKVGKIALTIGVSTVVLPLVTPIVTPTLAVAGVVAGIGGCVAVDLIKHTK